MNTKDLLGGMEKFRLAIKAAENGDKESLQALRLAISLSAASAPDEDIARIAAFILGIFDETIKGLSDAN